MIFQCQLSVYINDSKTGTIINWHKIVKVTKMCPYSLGIITTGKRISGKWINTDIRLIKINLK